MSDLTDRMRTCAAHIIASDVHEYDDVIGRVMRDAADLLIEASNLLEQAHLPLGEPMEIIVLDGNATTGSMSSTGWIAPGGPLPGLTHSGTISPRACPKCDSRANKTVRREGAKLMLVCPVCGATWEYKQ